MDIIETMDAREARQRELARQEILARIEREAAENLQQDLQLCLWMFDALASSSDAQERGYLLETLLNHLFLVCGIPAKPPFRRNEGVEQIDGGFRLEGWRYLVECRWRKERTDPAQLDGLLGKVNRSGKPAVGLFLRIEGWSDHVPRVLKQNADKSIILMDGYDLRSVLTDERVDLRGFLLAIVDALAYDTEPLLSARDFLARLS